MDVVASTDADGGHGSSGLAATQLFLPVNKRVPPVLITTRRVEELARSRLLVAIDHWPTDSAYPQVSAAWRVVRCALCVYSNYYCCCWCCFVVPLLLSSW
jgi:hypothetical protein